jgi:hypothetical protein
METLRRHVHLGLVSLLGLVLAMATAGCPDASSSNVVETCQKTGQKCRLDEGKLGVCMKKTDGTFQCQSQH